METIRLEIPLHPGALLAVSDALIELADKIDPVPTGVAPDGTIVAGTVFGPPPGPAAPSVPAAPVPATDAAPGATAPPPPPPAPPAADPPVETAPPADVDGVDVDANGLPWDVRIHAGGHSKIKDGTWRKKRGVANEVVTVVEAELRQLMSIPAAPAAGPPAPPATAAPPAPPAAAAAQTFPDLMLKITASPNTATPERIAEVLGAHGLQTLPSLSQRPDLVPAVTAALFPKG